MYASLLLVNQLRFTIVEAQFLHMDFTLHISSNYFHLALLRTLVYPDQLGQSQGYL